MNEQTAGDGPHNRRTRRLGLWILWPATMLALLAVAWAAAILYVQAKARLELVELRGAFFGSPSPPAAASLKDYSAWVGASEEILRVDLRGCSALPGLVEEMDSHDPRYLELIGSLFHTAIMRTQSFERGSHREVEIWKTLMAFRIVSSDAPGERDRKIAAIREWWKVQGHLYHQWWRFWSPACRAPLIEDF